MKVLLVLVVLSFWAQLPGRATEREMVSVAAAADLVFCLEELSVGFEKAHPAAKLRTTTGASGSLFAQISRGAPFDVFMAADVEYPRQLIAAGGAEKESLTTYAFGHLVLWTTKAELDVKRGLEVLREPAVKKFAIASPAHAPYGRAAKAALESAKLWGDLQPKLVLGENVAQTAHFVQTGNVDAGIVAFSFVLAPRMAGKGVYFEIPETAHPRLEQAAVLTRRGAENQSARVFLLYLRSEGARAIFERYGFRLPASK
jgi:molybdate transport system substrate-binding protein